MRRHRPGAAGAFGTLEMRGVGRRFGDTVALADVDLTVRAGELVALLGPSGSGKSTLLNCLAGLLPLTGGAILLDGERIDTVPPQHRGFGVVFQGYALFPHLTAGENVAFGLRVRGLPRREVVRRVAEALALVRLEEHVDALPGDLSGGQQQRVAIARAVAVEPRLMLMDEPLSSLDAQLRLEMRTEIRRMHQSLGLTTVYVTHDQEEALSMADRVVVLRDGRVQQVGTPAQLHDAPADWHVAGFVGYRNLLDLEVAGSAGGTVTLAGPGLTLLAATADPPAVGQRVRAAVRPEHVVVASPGAAPLPGDAVRATVSVVEYHGREFAVELVIPGGPVLHARTDHAPVVGSTVHVTVDPAHVRVYRGTPEAPPPGATGAAGVR